MLHTKHITVLFFLGMLFFSCKKTTSEKVLTVTPESEITNVYAEGFKITQLAVGKLLEIKNPWPNAEKSYSYVLLTKEEAMTSTFNSDDYDGIITVPIERIVVTSTTHIPALELLHSENTLVGFPGTDYISSEKTRRRIDKGLVRELGTNEGINTEVLLDLQPDVVIGFGIDGSSKSMDVITNATIPVIYNGDWVEKTPLAKAEWLKFFGVLFQKETQADYLFQQIAHDYKAAKTIASKATTKPSVLSGSMYKDIWYLPSGTSTEAQFLKDANTNYLWRDTQEAGSLALSFEAVFNRAKNAQLWLSPSYYGSYEALEKSNPHYTQFDAYKNKSIFTFSNTTGATGGVLYYELGTARPDLVLKDIIKICHPNLLPNYKTTFFKPLE